MINEITSLKILIIEDEHNEGIALQSALTVALPEAYIELVENGKDAENLVRVQPFDVLLIDYRLKDIDGLSLMKELEALCPGVTSIIVTGYSSVEVAVESITMGAYDFISKPVEIDSLVKSIKAAISDKRVLFEGRNKLKLMLDDNFKYNYDNQEFVTVIAAQDTSMLLDEKISLFGRIKNVFVAIKKYYWG